MSEPLLVTSNDSILNSLNFKPYRSTVERKAVPFLPAPGEPQTMQIQTPWGVELTAKSGDFLVSEVDKPGDYWPIDPVIFEESYVITRPGYCIKKAVTLLVPLTDLTGGDEDRMVTIETLEGPETVRAGDFYLAKGVRGEIWPYPKDKVGEVMAPVE
jgi:hypothetical protein